MLTLWLWLWLLPFAIGTWSRRWSHCLGLVAAYLLLFDLNTAIASIGTAQSLRIAAVIVNDDLMILTVTVAAHGLRQAFSSRET